MFVRESKLSQQAGNSCQVLEMQCPAQNGQRPKESWGWAKSQRGVRALNNIYALNLDDHELSSAYLCGQTVLRNARVFRIAL